MYACMTSVGFDTSDKFENHWSRYSFAKVLPQSCPSDFFSFYFELAIIPTSRSFRFV